MRALATPTLALALTAAPSADPPPTLPALDSAVLARAQAAGRPILLIVQDPACARCRGDEAEALADAPAARLLQGAFVAARVDRLERPDLDDLFVTAVEWLSGERGYPLAVALLPDGRPYAGRAPIGAEDRGAVPGLHRFALRAWSDFTHDRAAAEARAVSAAGALARAQRLAGGPAVAAPAGPALRGLQEAFDARLGGFGAGEAFAPPAALRLLLTALERGEDAAARRMLERTLAAVAATDRAPESLARRALLLEAFARAARLGDPGAYRATAAALADGAPALRQPDGAYVAFEDAAGAPVLAGWNGLVIGALALSGRAFDRPQDVEAARRAADAVLSRLGPPPRLRRSEGTAAAAALEDHAFLAEGLLRLHDALGGREPRHADAAAALVEAAVARYYDAESGGFFDLVAGPDAFVPAPLPQRLRSGYDAALPSANGVMAAVLFRLARAVSQPRYAELARRTVEAFAPAIQRAPRGMEGLAAAALEMQPADVAASPDPPLPRSAVVGGIAFAADVARAARAGEFVARLHMRIPPDRFVVAHDPGARDLVGLSLSVPAAGAAAGEVRYPPSRPLQGRWGSGAVNVHSGSATLEVPLRPGGGGAAERVRLRAVFQVCRDEGATCERPQAVVLDAPVPAAR